MAEKALRLAFSAGVQPCSPEEEFRKMARAGLLTAEISATDPDLLRENTAEIYARAAEKCGIELWSVHLPFRRMDLTSPDADHRAWVIDRYLKWIASWGDVGVKTFVVHGCSGIKPEESREDRIRIAKEVLVTLADKAAERGGVIALENQPRLGLGRTVEEMLDILSADERIKVCFDTNHLLMQSAREYLPKIAHRLRTIHVSDYDFKNERHWMPGEGSVCWPEMIQLLKEVGYGGPFIYELRLEPAKTINRRMLTYDDFKENYDTLMAGKIPAPIGTPIRELCIHWKDLN